MIEIYTDGSCIGNGKENAVGGAAFVVVKNEEKIYQESYGSKNTTNQRMELLAAATACEYVKREKVTECVAVYSDSAYLINCYKQDWWINWQNNGWKNSQKQPVANKDLWERIIPFFSDSNFIFKKVKGHSKNNTKAAYWNNMVDKLAVAASNLQKQEEIYER